MDAPHEALLAPENMPEMDDSKGDEQREINSVSDIDHTTPSPSPSPQPEISDTFDLVILAIEVYKRFLAGHPINEWRKGLCASDVEACVPLLEALIAGKKLPEIPDHALRYFQDTSALLWLDGVCMEEVCFDFDLFTTLDSDYVAVKGMFVPPPAYNRSWVLLDKLMPLLIGSEVRKVRLRNVAVSKETMECILGVIKDDKHKDDNHQLKAKVDEFVVHRVDGLRCDEIEYEYAREFSEYRRELRKYGWEITVNRTLSEIYISLDDGWEDPMIEDDDDAKQPPESGNKAEIGHKPTTPPPPPRMVDAATIQRLKRDLAEKDQALAEKDQALSKEKRDRKKSRESMRRRRKESHARHVEKLKEMEEKVFVSVWEYEKKGKWRPFPIEVQHEINAMAYGSSKEHYKEFKVKEQQIRVLRWGRDSGLCYDTRCNRTMYKVRRRKKRRTASKYPKWWTTSAQANTDYGTSYLVRMDLANTKNRHLLHALTEFNNTTPGSWRITRIDSVENQMLHDRHNAARQELRDCAQDLNVRCLWYGASTRRLESITKQGFGEFAWKGSYGEGVYFCAKAGHFDYHRLSPNVFQILFCRVICGKSTKGRAGITLNTWPKKSNGQIYDSLQNTKGSIVVVHDDARAYPLFVVYFKIGK